MTMIISTSIFFRMNFYFIKIDYFNFASLINIDSSLVLDKVSMECELDQYRICWLCSSDEGKRNNIKLALELRPHCLMVICYSKRVRDQSILNCVL